MFEQYLEDLKNLLNQKTFEGVRLRLLFSILLALMFGIALGTAYQHGGQHMQATVMAIITSKGGPLVFNLLALGGIALLCGRILFLGRTPFPASSFAWWLFFRPLIASLVSLIAFTGVCMGMALSYPGNQSATGMLAVSAIVLAVAGGPLLFLIWVSQPGKIFQNEIGVQAGAGVISMASAAVMYIEYLK